MFRCLGFRVSLSFLGFCSLFRFFEVFYVFFRVFSFS